MSWPITRFGPDPFHAEPKRFGVISGVSLLLALLLGWWIASGAGAPLAIDRLMPAIALPQQPVLHDVAVFLADITGSTEAAIVGVLIAAWFLAGPFWWRSALLLGTSVLLSAPLGNLLKDIFARPRPDWHTVEVKYFSYPSGHTIGTAVLMMALIVIIRRTWIGVLGVSWIALTVWGRIYLGAHWLTDTVGGLLIALAVVTGFAAIIAATTASVGSARR